MTALWLGLHFYGLPLEVFAPPPNTAAVAVARHRVVTANAAASGQGIKTGMRLASALTLVPEVLVHERSSAREAAAMEQLACWAGGFSPRVSVAGNDELLIEIGGCLNLFGGLQALCRSVQEGLDAQGFSAHLSLAPTP